MNNDNKELFELTLKVTKDTLDDLEKCSVYLDDLGLDEIIEMKMLLHKIGKLLETATQDTGLSASSNDQYDETFEMLTCSSGEGKD